MNKCLGGLYEDMIAYNGTTDWKKFYGVIYMTKPYLTDEQIQLNGKRIDIQPDWKIIRVIGQGSRKKVIEKK
jgi:hypothetical protein